MNCANPQPRRPLRLRLTWHVGLYDYPSTTTGLVPDADFSDNRESFPGIAAASSTPQDRFHSASMTSLTAELSSPMRRMTLTALPATAFDRASASTYRAECALLRRGSAGHDQ